MVDDEMPELDRFSLLFQRGQPVQRLSVMSNLPQLYASHGAGPLERLLGLISSEIPAMMRTAAADVDEEGTAVAAAQAIVALVGIEGGAAGEPVPSSLMERVLLPMAMTALEELPLAPAKEGAVSAEWLHALLALLRARRMSVATLESVMLPWALRFGDNQTSVGHKLLCAHTLGALAQANPEERWIQR